MQQNRAHGATAGGLLVFVWPAAIISERSASKQIRLFFRCRRIVDQHHQNLAAIIFRRSLVVIPLLLRRIDAIADKNQISLDRNMFGLCARESDKIIAKLKPLVLLWSIYAQFRFGISLHTYERHRLPKTSLRTGAF